MTHEEVMRYCEKIIANLHNFERHEMASPHCSRDVAVAAWVIRSLASPGNSESERVLSAIMERRKEVTAERMNDV